MIKRINELRTISDAKILDSDWNSSNPGYGIEPINIDEIALYCLEMQYRGKDIPLERFTPERAAAVEERRMYYLRRVINEAGSELTDYSDHPYSLYEQSEGYDSHLSFQGIKVSTPHEVACVRDMLQRIKRDADEIKLILKTLRNASKHRDRKPSDLPSPKKYMDSKYRDLLIEHLLCSDRRKAETIANKTIKLATKLYL